MAFLCRSECQLSSVVLLRYALSNIEGKRQKFDDKRVKRGVDVGFG